MQSVDSITTTQRDKMVCPECHQTGFEEITAIADDYSGKERVLKASRCQNTDCRFNHGLPPKIVQVQFDEDAYSSSILTQLKSVLSKLD